MLSLMSRHIFVISILLTKHVNASSYQIPQELIIEIANFSGSPELCSLAYVSKWHKNTTRNQWEIRREQTTARKGMAWFWERMRGYPGYHLIFGGWPIVNATAMQAIDHLIHDLDGHADLSFLAAYPLRDVIDTSALFPIMMDAFALKLKLRSYHEQHLCGGHPLCDPPHRYERFRWNISDDDMHLFDQYISLFLELSNRRNQIIKLLPRCLSLLEAFEWQKMMELIGARIRYPFMAFFTEQDLSEDADPFGVLFDCVLPEWSRVIDIDDCTKRLKAFQNKTGDFQSY